MLHRLFANHEGAEHAADHVLELRSRRGIHDSSIASLFIPDYAME